MGNFMRNKRTSEIRDVEPDSEEFYELRAQVDGDGHSVWEQTGAHHALALKEREENDALRDEDLGYEDQPTVVEPAVDIEALSPDPAPHLALTPGEVDAGITAEAKKEALEQQIPERENLDVGDGTNTSLPSLTGQRRAAGNTEEGGTQKDSGGRARKSRGAPTRKGEDKSAQTSARAGGRTAEASTGESEE